MLSTSLDSGYLKDELLQLKNPHVHKQSSSTHQHMCLMTWVTRLLITVVAKTCHMYKQAL